MTREQEKEWKSVVESASLQSYIMANRQISVTTPTLILAVDAELTLNKIALEETTKQLNEHIDEVKELRSELSSLTEKYSYICPACSGNYEIPTYDKDGKIDGGYFCPTCIKGRIWIMGHEEIRKTFEEDAGKCKCEYCQARLASYILLPVDIQPPESHWLGEGKTT